MSKLTPHFILLSLIFSATTSAWAHAISTSWHEKREAPPSGFIPVSAAPSNATLKFRIALTQKNFKGLEQSLYDTSTPGEPKYGSWLSKAEVESFVKPSTEATQAVEHWLASNGVAPSALSPSGDWIAVEMSVAKANELLGAEFTTFKSANPGQEAREVVRTLAYDLPKEVKGYVATIHPTIAFPIYTDVSETAKVRHLATSPAAPNTTASSDSDSQPTRNATLHGRSLPLIPSSCIADWEVPTGWVKPYTAQCRFDYYGLPKDLSPRREDNSLWLSGFQHSFVHKRVIKEYISKFRPDIPEEIMFDVVSIDGGVNNQLWWPITPFATIMMTVLASTAPTVPLTFMTVGTDSSPDPIDWLLNHADHLLAMENPPKVVVVGDSLPERAVPKPLAERLCGMYAQLSARGVTLVHAVLWGGVDPTYDWPEDRECPNGFDVSFPASCPYVTSVGGTEIDMWNSPIVETASLYDGSSGGWSNYFPRPAYQDRDVTEYLGGLGNTYEGMFDPRGRATPDLAGFHSVENAVRGGANTNPAFAASLFASMIALINDERLSKGQSTMGFANPWIYANKEVFNDITRGTNPGCLTGGFNATEGWDPVSGIGSPMFEKLRAAAGL